MAKPVELTIPVQHPCPWWYVGNGEHFKPKVSPLTVTVEVSSRDRNIYVLSVEPALRVWRGHKIVFRRAVTLGIRRELNLPDAWVHFDRDMVYCVDSDTSEREPTEA